MKQLILTVIAVLTLCFSASAQRIEIFGGYSVGSEIGKTPDIHAPFDNAVGVTMFNDAPERQKTALTIGVNARILGNLSIGLSWTGLNTYKQPMHYRNSSAIDNVEQSSNTVLFSVKYEWLKLWKLHLYSRAGVGAVFYSDPEYSDYMKTYMNNFDWRDGKPESCKRFAWQVSYLGVELRPIRNLGVFAEGGLGRQGALMAGVKVFL